MVTELGLIDSYTLNPTSNTESGLRTPRQTVQRWARSRTHRRWLRCFPNPAVLAQCYYAPEGSILILEQPEAHLHPKAQSELADVLIDVVKNRNIQIILESHSEHLLLRLMRRIAEEEDFSGSDGIPFLRDRGR